MSGFVLDASVTLVWLFDDESHKAAEHALSVLEESGATVPLLWEAEIRNALLVAIRRERLSEDQAQMRLTALADLPILLDTTPNLDTAFALAQRYGLSFYDALYLELAIRLSSPLASLDKQLLKAATKGEGLPPL